MVASEGSSPDRRLAICTRNPPDRDQMACSTLSRPSSNRMRFRSSSGIYAESTVGLNESACTITLASRAPVSAAETPLTDTKRESHWQCLAWADCRWLRTRPSSRFDPTVHRHTPSRPGLLVGVLPTLGGRVTRDHFFERGLV
jgi:hypothetical protein